MRYGNPAFIWETFSLLKIDCRVTDVAWNRVRLTIGIVTSTVDVPDAPVPLDVLTSRETEMLNAAAAAAEQPDAPDLEQAAATERQRITDAVDQGTLTFAIRERGRRFPVRTTCLGDGRYQLSLTITDFHNRRQVPDGTWRIIPVIDGQAYTPARYPLDRASDLESFARVFLYDQNRTAYTVSFGVSESDVRPEFLLRTYQFFRNPQRNAKKPPLTRRLRRRLDNKKNRLKVVNRYYRMSRRYDRPRGNRILFASEARTSLQGNLLAVRDRMVERGLDKDFEFHYSFLTPDTADYAKRLRAIRLLATCDVVLIDDYFPTLNSLNLAPGTKIIQLWHAGSGFKAVGFSRFGMYGSPKFTNAHRKYTYAITGSTHLVPVYAEAFGIEESAVIPTGLPRIDGFLDPARARDAVDGFFLAYPELQGKRLVLFAPTFRGRGMTSAYYDYTRIDFDQLYEYCGADTVVLFRMHHFVKEPVPIPAEYTDRLLDFSHFHNGNDLLHVTDLLITDYSSIIYEYSLLDRPMLFYAYDKEIYAATRGFHRDYDETAPGKVCDTFDELLAAMRADDYGIERVARFREENFDHVDTQSSDRVIDWLILGDPQMENS